MQKEQTDLRERTKEFALRIIRMFSVLPKSTEAQVLGKQVLHSGTFMSAAYWEIGRRIIAFEQQGRERADYGERVIEELSTDLKSQYGRGFGRSTLFQIRAFFLAYEQKVQTLFGQFDRESIDLLRKALPLPWSHYIRPVPITDSAILNRSTDKAACFFILPCYFAWRPRQSPPTFRRATPQVAR